ncbi:hypothetical protein ABN211_04190 [Proteus terrae]|uniref:hypothetical protein n=2 Tax=Proteus terrae TaxID=1574161 RepID=UPI000D6975CA|nr:hypothetical protein [Proteus terrae]
MFSIDNEVKLKFNLRDIIFDIVNNKETIAENRPLEKNNVWIDSIIENINKNNIINNNEDFISIIEKIKRECLFHSKKQ